MHHMLFSVAERIYFSACLALGKLLRSARYSKTRIVCEDGERLVRKYRAFHAPLLIWMGGGLMKLLDTGVRVLPRREWEERERRVWRLCGLSADAIRSDDDGTLVMPWLAGETLAGLLEDPRIKEPARQRMIERAVVALTEFHRLGLTHGDAMADNVMIDVDAGVARWFDFETIHESSGPRSMSISVSWQRADDVRALLATCLVRTAPAMRAETLRLVLDAYAADDDADDAHEVTSLLIESFGAVFQRPLMFHLAQAPLSMQSYREIARLLSARLGENVGERIVHEPDPV